MRAFGGGVCGVCKAPWAFVPEDLRVELNAPHRACLCDAKRVHEAMTGAGLVALDGGHMHTTDDDLGGDDAALRDGGWPVTPALSYGEDDEGVPHAYQRYYADEWAVTVTRFLFRRSGERIRARCVDVLRRGLADPDFRAATMVVHRIGGRKAFAAALLMRPR